jgi:hypothetical protein
MSFRCHVVSLRIEETNERLKAVNNRYLYVLDKTWAADLYLIYKLEPKARVCISDTDRMRMLSYLKNDLSYEFIGEVILKINIV